MHPEVEYFLSQLLNGLSMGSMYAMIAVGYSMVYSLLYLVNFAHGDLYVFGTFVVFSFASMGFPIFAAMILGGLVAGLIGMTIEKTIYRPVREANRIVPMISALGASLILKTVAQIIWGPEALAFPSLIKHGYVKIGTFMIQYQQIFGVMCRIDIYALVDFCHDKNKDRKSDAMHYAEYPSFNINGYSSKQNHRCYLWFGRLYRCNRWCDVLLILQHDQY